MHSFEDRHLVTCGSGAFCKKYDPGGSAISGSPGLSLAATISRLRNRREQERLEGCFGIVVVSRATRRAPG
jgi:hypothetical protein